MPEPQLPPVPGTLSPDTAVVAANLIASPTFQLLITTVRQVTPSHPEVGDAAHVAAQKAFLRQGFELALETLINLPRATLNPQVAPIFDTRD